MAINTKVSLITEIDKLIDSIEKNQETTGLLNGLYSIVQQVDRSFIRETKFKAKGSKPVGKTIKMPPNFQPTAEELAEIEKKRDLILTAPPVEPDQEKEPEPIMVETKEPTNEAELLDIFTDGVEGAKEKFKTPKAFAKKLKDLGFATTGKTYDDIYSELEAKFNG